MSEFADRLTTLVGSEVSLTRGQLTQLESHFELLRQWNQKLNLTAVRNDAEAVDRHYAESVYFSHILRQHPKLSGQAVAVADVGSGAGFPGFVLAVLQPSWTVTLIESHRRKAVFLSEAGRSVGNVHVVAGRAEQVAQRFDCVVSRAVRPEDVMDLIPRLGATVGFLVSTAQAEELAKAAMRWDVAAPLPWATNRVVLVGVPRGTPQPPHQ